MKDHAIINCATNKTLKMMFVCYSNISNYRVSNMGYGCSGAYYWEKGNVPNWDEIRREMPSVFLRFKLEGQKLYTANNVEHNQYISDASLQRFEFLFNDFLEAIDQYDKSHDLPPMKQWILLGAITEVTLQIILAVYNSDYINERWQQWEEFDSKNVQEALSDVSSQVSFHRKT